MEPHEDTIFDENAPAGKDALAEINFEVLDTGRWLLKVLSGPNKGAEFSMQAANTYTIGTDPNTCDVVFHDTSVSRQHVRIAISSEDALSIEDLQSRNGTLMDGEPLKIKKALPPNTVVSLGTTSFIVYDREGEMQTIISPFLPSIVKVLQKEEEKKDGEKTGAPSSIQEETALQRAKEKASHHFGSMIAIAIIGGLLLIAGIGTVSLFQSHPVVVAEPVNIEGQLHDALSPFPSIKYQFNKTTGTLLLIGHVLTNTNRNQIRYNLEGLSFVRSIDDSGVIIDEFVWQEMNQLLTNNPNWRGITIQATAPGHFVLSGYLQTRKQAEQLSQYVSENFRYLDLLEKKVVVDEDVIAGVTSQLQTLGLKNAAVQVSNGELVISGNLPGNKTEAFQKLLKQFSGIQGVWNVRNLVTELPPEQTLINISDKYTVTGYSNLGNTISVVINGRILSQGDSLDGMAITTIKPNMIMLEKDAVKYRIDYSR
jgi:type III secretion system YscD/HrpQ family protein